MQRHFPEETGEAALEGEVAHEAAALAIRNNPPPVGWKHPNGRLLTEAMVEDCAPYVQACQADAEAAEYSGGFAHVEERVHAHQYISPHCEGTPDFFAVFPREKRVRLRDLKYGHGYVDAFRNGQLTVYLYTIANTFGLSLADGWTLEGFIHQPRNWHPDGHERRWIVSGAELMRELPAWRHAADEAVHNPVCRTGSWCRYCPAAHACETLQRDASYSRQVAGQALVHIQDGAALGRELSANKRALAVLKARQEGLEEQALALAAQGGRVAGWKGDYRPGRTTWSVAIERVIRWCDLLGVDARKPGVKTPKQVAGLGVDPAHLEAITTTPTTYVLEEVTPHQIAKALHNG